MQITVICFLLITKIIHGKELCLKGPMYGQTSNRIMGLARIIDLSQKSQKYPRYDKEWEHFIEKNLDLERLTPDIWNKTRMGCIEGNEVFNGKEAFSLMHTKMNEIIGEFLYPNKEAEREANEIIGKNKDVVSVHRRSLEKECYWKTALYKVSNTSCNFQLKHIRDKLNKNTTVVILTDEQDKSGDNQFQKDMKKENIMFIPVTKRSILVDYWIGIKARLHIGNPISTVDSLIRVWKEKLKSGEYYQDAKFQN